MNASATNLYGICRELGHCVEDCGLCAKISAPNTRPAHRATIFDIPELEPDEVEQVKLPKATPVTWDDVKLKMCDWCRRKLGGHYAWCQEK